MVYWFSHFGIVLVLANSIINPFIYAAKYGEFQDGVRRMIARLTGKQNQIQPQQNINNTPMMSNPTGQQIQDTAIT